LLLWSTTALANGERNLVARAAWVLGTLERLTAEQQDGCVIIEGLARVATDFRHRFAEGREDLAGKLQAEHVALEVGVRNVVSFNRQCAASSLISNTNPPAR